MRTVAATVRVRGDLIDVMPVLLFIFDVEVFRFAKQSKPEPVGCYTNVFQRARLHSLTKEAYGVERCSMRKATG